MTNEVRVPKISLLHASYKSLNQSRKVRDYWLATAHNPHNVEHCLGFEIQDILVRKDYDLDNSDFGVSPDLLTKFKTTPELKSPSAVRNWNAAASISSGKILLGIADDLIPERNWDLKLWDLVAPKINDLALWKLSDHRCFMRQEALGSDILPRHPVMTRKTYDSYGFYFNPKYVSIGPDDEWMLEALNRGFFFDGRAVRLHHSIGPIFDANSKILCGCFEAEARSVRTESQNRMHQQGWKIQAEENLRRWGIELRVIRRIKMSGEISDEIFNYSTKINDKNRISIFQYLILNSKLKVSFKIILIVKLIRELFN